MFYSSYTCFFDKILKMRQGLRGRRDCYCLLIVDTAGALRLFYDYIWAA